jgi:hypothetical protein
MLGAYIRQDTGGSTLVTVFLSLGTRNTVPNTVPKLEPFGTGFSSGTLFLPSLLGTASTCSESAVLETPPF